jgi:hypothetical protein
MLGRLRHASLALAICLVCASPAAACRYFPKQLIQAEAFDMVDKAHTIFEGTVISATKTLRARVRVTKGIKGIAEGTIVDVDGNAGSCSVFVKVGDQLRFVVSSEEPRQTSEIQLQEATQFLVDQVWRYPEVLANAQGAK